MTTYNIIKKSIERDRLQKTKKLIQAAQKTIRGAPGKLKNDLMELIAQGLCPRCKDKFLIVHSEHIAERAKYELACGCTILVNKTGESIEKSGADYAARYSRIGGKDLYFTHDGKIIRKENDEVAVTHIFLRAAYPKFEKVKSNQEQNSPIDTIAYNKEDQLYIQVTKLFEGKFWQKLATHGEANIDKLNIETIIKLIENAIERKINVDSKQKEQIILLISSWPGVHDKYFDEITKSINEYANKSGYKEIWLVGAIPELTTKLI